MATSTSDRTVTSERRRAAPRNTRRYAVRMAVREFGVDQCTDLAAALTYYAILSIFPAAVKLLPRPARNYRKRGRMQMRATQVTSLMLTRRTATATTPKHSD